ncbi:hypothetical protein B0H13DRAFT_2379611 [Mycena leptocephala]|nr:hypothetical protein B0H13DRAFT_2379611 [Mycena leptocephala]
MTKRKAVAGHDAASVPADDAPTLSKQENEAWAFFQDFECSEVVELFSESRFLASSGNRIMDLLDRVQPHIRSYRARFARGPSAVDNYVFQVWSVYKAAVKLFPNLSFSGRYPDIDGSVQRPLFDAMSVILSTARLHLLIPKTTSVFSISFSDDESPENQPPKKKPKGPKRTASPLPRALLVTTFVEQLLRRKTSRYRPPKSSTKGPVIKAERVLPKPKPRNRKSRLKRRPKLLVVLRKPHLRHLLCLWRSTMTVRIHLTTSPSSPTLRRITNTMLPLIVLETPRLLPLSNWSLKRSCMMEYCLRKVTGPSSSARLARRALPSAFFADGTSPATRAVKRLRPLQSAGATALMANLNNIIRLRRSADVFHKLAGHALVDYERGCEDFAIQYFQMRESFPSDDFTQFFEDPESIKAIETLFKRLDITYETALAKHRERHPSPSVSYRPVAPEMLPDADPQQAEIPFYTRPGPDEMLYTTRNTFKPLADSSSRASCAVFEQNTTDEDYKMTIHPFDTDDVPFPISRSPSPAPRSPPQVPHQKARLSSPRESSPPRTQAAYPAVQDDVPSYLREKNPQVASQLPPHHYLDKRVLVQESKPPSAGHRKGPLSSRPTEPRAPAKAASSSRLWETAPPVSKPSAPRPRETLGSVYETYAVPPPSRPTHRSAGSSIPRPSSHAHPSRQEDSSFRDQPQQPCLYDGTPVPRPASPSHPGQRSPLHQRFSLTLPPPSSAARNYFSSTADQQKPRNRPVRAPSLEDEEAASPTVFDESTPTRLQPLAPRFSDPS